jgi:glycolate oxidase iron-sulfur subunit
MQTKLADFIKGTPEGDEAEAILRSCVHCGFCTATCPTYQLLGDELDGPRGRIYLIKQVLEGVEPTRKTQLHLDRCLTCRNCETTCPSGVKYGRLADIGRKVVEERVGRAPADRIRRTLIKETLPRQWIFKPAFKAGKMVRPLLSPELQDKLADTALEGRWPTATHARKMLLLEGCVQPSMSPNINAATARVLDRLGVQLVIAPKAGCCGALRFHLNDQAAGLDDMRRNIDAWWPLVEEVEAIVMTASGCGVTVKEYGHLLAHDPGYAAKAARISAMTRDISEILQPMASIIHALASAHQPAAAKLAYHPPCTLQHGQQVRGMAEEVLSSAGVEVVHCADSHTCCGSAGAYSLLHPDIAEALRDRKLANLAGTGAAEIASANIGCISHLQSGTGTPVRHWIEVLDERLSS